MPLFGSYLLNLCLPYGPANLFIDVYHRELNPPKNKYMIVYSNFMPINRRMWALCIFI